MKRGSSKICAPRPPRWKPATWSGTDAAWWRLVRAYPYLGTLPRVVTYVGPTPGRVRIYQLKLAAGSRREARILCRNLHRVGRGCAVLR